MHPNSFLRTFWQLEVRPQVFVAMTFDQRYSSRFTNVIEPAISGIRIQGKALSARRVDESKSGDSILTDIVDGIAHARMVLADISTVGTDKEGGAPYRNGDVMYEGALALARRR